MVSRRVVLCLVSCVACIGAALAGCTSGTTPDCSKPNSGCGPGFDGAPPPDGEADAASEQTPDSAMDVTGDVTADVGQDVAQDVAQEAAPDVALDGPDKACFSITGAGHSRVCTYTDNAPACAPGEAPGHCPSTGLAGCCVIADGGLVATCFYVKNASAEQTTCTTAGNTWVTTAP